MDDLFAGSPPSLTLAPRPGSLSPDDVRARVAALALPSPRRKLLLGLALLWHDDWSGAHAVAQDHEGQSDFDLLHGIGHRREGDYSNADYWFSSAGTHACFPAIAAAVAKELPEDDAARERLLKGGRWNPKAFTAEVKASKKDTEASRLVRVQALELRAFADWLVSA